MIELGLGIVSAEVVVVGTRSEGREPLASPVPVELVPGERLRNSGHVETEWRTAFCTGIGENFENPFLDSDRSIAIYFQRELYLTSIDQSVRMIPKCPLSISNFRSEDEPFRQIMGTLCLPPALQPNHDPVQHKAVAGACGGAVMTNGGRARASAPHGTRPTFVVDRSNRSVGQTAGHKRMRK